MTSFKYKVQLQFSVMDNEAEYETVLASLSVVKTLGVKNLRLRFDSKLIIGQITNEYDCRNRSLTV